MDRPKTYKSLREANIERNKLWDPKNKIDGTYRGNELAGEVGEACNKVKKLEREKLGLPGSRTSIHELAGELGDAQICLDLLAMHYGIDLKMITAKVFNEKSDELNLPVRLQFNTTITKTLKGPDITQIPKSDLPELDPEIEKLINEEISRKLETYRDKLLSALYFINTP